MKKIFTYTLIITLSTFSLTGSNNSNINQTNQKSFKIYKEKFKNNIYIVTAESGLIIREKPSLEEKRIGSIPFGSKIDVLEKTNVKLTIRDNGKETKGNWVKIKTYKHPYYYAEGIEFGYVFNGFLKNEAEFILELENKMQKYPEFQNYEIVKENNPFVLNGDFFGDNIKDIVLKIKNFKIITLGFIDYKKNGKEKVVIINKENLSDEALNFGWTERFETVSKNINLWPKNEDMSNINVNFKYPDNKKFVLDYNALYGHNLESCGGGYIFWYNNKFHTITGD